MSYAIVKVGRKWEVQQDDVTIWSIQSKKAAEEYVAGLQAAPEIVKNASGKGWDLVVAGTVVATYLKKADATAELKAAMADVEAVEAEQAPDPATMPRADRLIAAKAEKAAVEEWKAAGSEGEAPATPVLDFMRDPRNDSARKAKSSKGSGRAAIKPEDEKAVLSIVVKLRKAGQSWEAIRKHFETEPFRMTNGEVIGVSPLYLLAKRSGDVRNPEVKTAAKGSK